MWMYAGYSWIGRCPRHGERVSAGQDRKAPRITEGAMCGVWTLIKGVLPIPLRPEKAAAINAPSPQAPPSTRRRTRFPPTLFTSYPLAGLLSSWPFLATPFSQGSIGYRAIDMPPPRRIAQPTEWMALCGKGRTPLQARPPCLQVGHSRFRERIPDFWKGFWNRSMPMASAGVTQGGKARVGGPSRGPVLERQGARRVVRPHRGQEGLVVGGPSSPWSWA
jgi:hypothetical protein